MRKAAGVVAAASAWLYTAAHFVASGIKQPLGNFSGDFLASFPSWRLSVLLGRQDLFKGSLADEWARMLDPQLAFIYAVAHFIFSGIKRNFLAVFPSGRLSVWLGGLHLLKGSLAEEWARMFSPHPLWHYGPVEHLVTLPLFAFSALRSAYMAWLIANYVFLIAILALAVRLFDSGRPKWVWLSVVVFAVFNYGPLYEALTQRTIEIFELLLIFVAYALLLRGRSPASGVAIGFAAMTKFLPLIFLPYFAVKRSFRALASSAIVITLIAIATEAVFGWRYSGIVLQLRRGGAITSQLDQSLAGMIMRLLVWTRSSLSRAMVSNGAIVIALIALAWLFFRTRDCATIADLEWSTLIVAMVLLPPHNQQYYFVLLLFPYLALAARELRPGVRTNRARRWWLAISFVLTGIVVPVSVLNKMAGAKIFPLYLSLGVPFIGAAILAAICVHAVVTESESAVSGTPRAV